MTRPSKCVQLTLLCGAVLALAGCDEQAPPPPPVRPVLSIVVQPGPAAPERFFTGLVEPRYRAQIGFRIAGRMVSREVNVGDLVSRGQPLAALDPALPRQALISAQASLAGAQAQLTNAAAAYGRQQDLLRSGTVSQAQVDAAVATRNTAQARVEQAQASLQKAEEQLGYTRLTSDYDGVIAAWNAEVGQVVSVGQTVVTIARPDERDAVFDIPDDRVDRFPQGASLPVTLLSRESLSVQGQVREVAPQSDAATRTRRIRLTLQSPPDAFRLGTTVRVGLTDTGAPRIELPASAILEHDGQTSVWLVGTDGRVARRAVSTGERRGDQVVLTSGIAAGDRVVTAGVHSLTDGQTVRITQR